MELITNHSDLRSKGGAYVYLSPDEFDHLIDLANEREIKVCNILKDIILPKLTTEKQDALARSFSVRNPSFSAREREVAAHVAQGLKNPEIAEEMAISEQTVKNHLSNMRDKLGIKGLRIRDAVMVWYAKNGGGTKATDEIVLADPTDESKMSV